MSRESEVYTRLAGDATLLTTLTGGVFKREELGREGITRETASGAFDATTGYLKPCALVSQRNIVPTYDVADEMTPLRSVSQVVELFLFDDTGYTSIDTAMLRIFRLLEGYSLSDGYPLSMINVVDRDRDKGALKGHAKVRMDFTVHWIMQ
jgi:hypothetical protein